ncbi:MAG: NUDIX hydrolase [Dysgonamonadaceae bacterium]|jgi:ADP-ribose pyrophosphatase|nr:NUDIX hydrolase [Dysgonamonadaceae bacterium]MDD3309885.1 NUDIX hydrolase [Dysgonamonadaceae bacterium]MDD3901166.1 NUDIX hydrolase [Dysgonamonadaceae bacterium]MDD4399488.1 NUDIX hydrolase [Dysgonamonadaceae bacterium]MEA5082302.1 NUDIX hydrolase [Dysgonamonadaceae bacterium]
MTSLNEKEIREWKLLSSEYLYKRPWLTARMDRLEMPDNTIVPEYYVLEYPDWVNIIAITKKGEFVFVKQYRHGIGKICMEICAGVCEDSDKSPLDAAKRELLEETGYGNGSWKELMRLSPNASATNNMSYCFIAEGVEKISDQSLDVSEDISVYLLSLNEVKELLNNGDIVQATMAAPLWKYMNMINNR